MPRGDKSKYTEKQKRQAEHIEEGYKSRGRLTPKIFLWRSERWPTTRTCTVKSTA